MNLTKLKQAINEILDESLDESSSNDSKLTFNINNVASDIIEAFFDYSIQKGKFTNLISINPTKYISNFAFSSSQVNNKIEYKSTFNVILPKELFKWQKIAEIKSTEIENSLNLVKTANLSENKTKVLLISEDANNWIIKISLIKTFIS